MHLVEPPPVEQRQRADRDLAFGVEFFQRSNVDRLFAEDVFRLGGRLRRGDRLGGEAEVGERGRKRVELERQLGTHAGRDHRHLTRELARPGADLQVVQPDHAVLYRDLRIHRSLLAVELALHGDRVGPALTEQLLERPEIALQRHGSVVDLAPETAADGSLRVAGVQRKRFDHDRRHVAGLAVAECHRAVGDRDIADREAAQRCARRRWGASRRRGRQRRKLPVALAARIGLERDRRFDQLETDNLEALAQERQKLDLGLDVLRRDHLRLLAPRRVAERDIIEHQLGLQSQLEIDPAADRQIAPGGVLDPLLDRTDEFLDVDGADGDRDGDQQQQDHTAEHRQSSPENPHRGILARSAWRHESSPQPDSEVRRRSPAPQRRH